MTAVLPVTTVLAPGKQWLMIRHVGCTPRCPAVGAVLTRHGNWPRIRGFPLEKKKSAPKNKTVRSN